MCLTIWWLGFVFQFWFDSGLLQLCEHTSILRKTVLLLERCLTVFYCIRNLFWSWWRRLNIWSLDCGVVLFKRLAGLSWAVYVTIKCITVYRRWFNEEIYASTVGGILRLTLIRCHSFPFSFTAFIMAGVFLKLLDFLQDAHISVSSRSSFLHSIINTEDKILQITFYKRKQWSDDAVKRHLLSRSYPAFTALFMFEQS